MNKGSEGNFRKNFMFVFKDLLVWDALVVPLAIIRIICIAVGPALAIFLPKLIIDSLTLGERSFEETAILISALSLGILIVSIIAHYTDVRLGLSGMVSRAHYNVQFGMKSLSVHYTSLETSEGQLAREKANRSIRKYTAGTEAIVMHTVSFFGHLLGLAIYVYMVVNLNWTVFVALIAGAMFSFIASQSARKFESEHIDEYEELDKKRRYGFLRIQDFKTAKDIRLFRMQDWIISVLKTFSSDQLLLLRSMKMKHFQAGAVSLLVNMLRDGLAYVYLTTLVVNGEVSVGEYSVLFAAIAGISNWLNSLLLDIGNLDVAQREIGYLREYLALPNEDNIDLADTSVE